MKNCDVGIDKKRYRESVLNKTRFNHHEIRHAGLSLWLRNN